MSLHIYHKGSKTAKKRPRKCETITQVALRMSRKENKGTTMISSRMSRCCLTE